jgi:hypothetical protein
LTVAKPPPKFCTRWLSRSKRPGDAFTLVTWEDRDQVLALDRFLGAPLDPKSVVSFESNSAVLKASFSLAGELWEGKNARVMDGDSGGDVTRRSNGLPAVLAAPGSVSRPF